MEENNGKVIPVLGKIFTIFKCETVEGKSNKPDRDRKFLATNELLESFKDALESGTKFVVTGKVDGTCCLIKDSIFMKRRDIKNGRKIPPKWIETCGEDKNGHRIGFLPIESKGNDDKWFREVITITDNLTTVKTLVIKDSKLVIENVPIETLEGKTVEFVGPKVQCDPHGILEHCVIPHGIFELDNFPCDFNFEQFVEWFKTDEKTQFFEGVVVHFENGQLFKIHRHHLDLPWNPEKRLVDLQL